MTTYPLTTLAATVSATGISAPSYADILASLQASFKIIYGQDAYLETDSQDGQLLAVFAQAVFDCNNTAISVYNSYSPATSQGVALSNNVKLNGLRRLIPSNSTAVVDIGGTVGTIIFDGIISDGNGNQWSLPSTITIPIEGTIAVTATALLEGNISAPANTITIIATPTRGWQTVNNAADAIPGAPVEADATLRGRQSVSTSLPAITPRQAIYASVANVEGVEQLEVYQNNTDSTDGNGIPSHSIAVVVEGGDTIQVATAIALKTSPGTGTYGTTTEVIIDSEGVPNTINFFEAALVPIDIHITIKAYTGYVSTTGDLIQSQLEAYLNSVGIGGVGGFVFNSKLYAPADDTGNLGLTYNVTALTMRRGSNSFSTSDIAIAFNELPQGGTITMVVD